MKHSWVEGVFHDKENVDVVGLLLVSYERSENHESTHVTSCARDGENPLKPKPDCNPLWILNREPTQNLLQRRFVDAVRQLADFIESR